MLFNEKRTYTYMDQYNIDVIVASLPVNVSYFTGLDCWFYRHFKEYMVKPGGSNGLVPLFSVLPRNGKPILIIDKTFAITGSKLGVRNIRPYGTYSGKLPTSNVTQKLDEDEKWIYNILSSTEGNLSAQQTLFSVIKELGLEKSNICLDSNCINLRRSLTKKYPRAKIKNGMQLVRLIRMVKSEREIKRVVECANINEQNAISCLKGVKEGALSGDVEQAFREGIAKQGASFEHFTFSRNGLGISSDPQRQFRKGDSIVFDFGCIHRMYYSDTAITIIVNDVSQRLEEIYRSLNETIKEVAEDVVPGIRSSTAYNMMYKTLADKGVKYFSAEGHGIGLEVRDYPIVMACNNRFLTDDFVKISSDLPIEEGMVINLEIAHSQLGTASIGIEKTFLVVTMGLREIVEQNRGI